MAEPAEIFVPAAAAMPIVEARLAAGWVLLVVTAARVKRRDTTPDPTLEVDFGPGGTADIEAARAALMAWPPGPDLFAEIRFVAR